MSGVNHVFLIGNLGRDPEIRYTPQGKAVCSFSIATSESWTDKATNEKKSTTEWHRIVVWGKNAENCNQYLSKGKQVCVEGKIQSHKYKDKNEVDRVAVEIVANSVTFLGGKEKETQNEQPDVFDQDNNQPAN